MGPFGQISFFLFISCFAIQSVKSEKITKPLCGKYGLVIQNATLLTDNNLLVSWISDGQNAVDKAALEISTALIDNGQQDGMVITTEERVLVSSPFYLSQEVGVFSHEILSNGSWSHFLLKILPDNECQEEADSQFYLLNVEDAGNTNSELTVATIIVGICGIILALMMGVWCFLAFWVDRKVTKAKTYLFPGSNKMTTANTLPVNAPQNLTYIQKGGKAQQIIIVPSVSVSIVNTIEHCQSYDTTSSGSGSGGRKVDDLVMKMIQDAPSPPMTTPFDSHPSSSMTALSGLTDGSTSTLESYHTAHGSCRSIDLIEREGK